MIITEVHENGAQQDKLGLTESYVKTFWRHGKQLLKGATVLGAGIFTYGVWRYVTREASLIADENRNNIASAVNAPNALSPVLNNELSSAILWQNNIDDQSKILTVPVLRRKATNCLAGIEQLGEFRVNTYTASTQDAPAITRLSDGSFVVIWESLGQDGSVFGVYGQRYGASGAPLGTEFRVNTYTTSEQIYPAITGLADGNFVVVWGSDGQDGFGYGVYGQRYAASGTTLGTEFQVDTYTLGSQSSPSITGLSDGSFVVVWQSNGQDGFGDGIYGQRYAASGTTLGGEFQVNTYTSSHQQSPAITGLTDGNFVVVWQSYDQDGSSEGVYGQRYAALGTALGSEFRANTDTAYGQGTPAITALSDGSFVVVWQSSQDGSNAGVYGQRYTASGTALGTEFQVNTYTINYQGTPAITRLVDGGFVVVWQSSLQDGSGYGVYGQRYTASGTALGAEFQVNTYITNNQNYPAITGLPDGSFVVVWQSAGQDGDSDGIYGQRYWTTIGLLNSCDASYTEDINYALNLKLLPLTQSYFLNATVMLQPLISGQLVHSTNPLDATANYNATLGRWFAAGSSLGVDNLLQGLHFNPTVNYNQNVQLNIALMDNTGNSFTSNFTLTGIPVDDVSVWVKNHLMINQGETRTLTTTNLLVTDVDTPNNAIDIMVNNVQYGQFEFTSQPGTAITTFTQQNINSGMVAFAHNDLAFAPSYTLVANDGTLTTPESKVTVDFDLRPNIVNNALTIQKPGDTILLTNLQILAQDSDNLPRELLFTVSNAAHGRFQIATNQDQTATIFTQQDINDGLVRFIHDGSQEVPSYTLTASDGRVSSVPSEGDVTFSTQIKSKIPYTETTGFKSGISIGITAVGTLVGFAAWRYRNNQDAKRRRQQSLIGNIIRTDLNLSGIHDFTTYHGVQFLEALSCIIEELKDKNIKVIKMTSDEQENFAHKLAECLKVYIVHEPPKDVLASDNIVTQTYRYYYYHKVKPLLKSNPSWLDTDAAKKAADVIAINVKAKLDTQEQDIESGSTNTKGSKSSVMMQPLLSHN